MIKVIRKIGYFNCILVGLISFLWISVFFIGDLFGVYAWTLLKLVLPFLGVVGLLINMVFLIITIIKKKRSIKLFSNFMINIVIAFPLLMTLNFISFAYPNTLQKTKPSLTVNWPFTEQTVVGWGGDSVNDNLPHATWASERWAYDLVMEPYNINSVDNNDFGIWNKEVHSPVSGTIIAVYDDDDDITPGLEDFNSMEGNHVYIKIKETGTYLLLNHLKKDSVLVEVGDTVKTGDILGRVGNSGSTSEPHLHIHHQRQDPTEVKFPVLAEGLPLYFKDINGSSMPQKGDIITPEY
ncbi:M23 family metallopeptidase [Lysinibacillus sp. NPDC096418]|uniref:M23 family metallopeptidase n=1 Tax=Lysinibacillus sp. NPDC096418 TaxID=3364138 RepID=UPI00380449E7